MMPLKGLKTYLAAAALAVLAVIALSNGDGAKASELFAAALAAVGLRSAIANPPAPIPAPDAPAAPPSTPASEKRA